MSIQKIFSFLVYPGKNIDPNPPVSGTEIGLNGRMYNLLKDVYDKSETECDIPVRFIPTTDVGQENEARRLILHIIQTPDFNLVKNLAERLSENTTRNPGLGLLFVILGKEGNRNKIVLSRFPADEGVSAEPSSQGLSVQFLEKIFMRSLKAYKAAVYVGQSFSSDFWEGKIIDKQLKSRPNKVALYWLKEFLKSDFFTTSAAGSRRLGLVLRNATHITGDLETKQEILGLTLMLRGFSGQTVSFSQLAERFHLSDDSKNVIRGLLTSQNLYEDAFELDYDEFIYSAPFASIELDNDAILTAPSYKFDNCFTREPLGDNNFLFQTHGRIVNETLRGRK